MFDENMHGTTVETLEIDIQSCRNGWLDFVIKTDTQENIIHASAVFNIFPSLLSWLEAIVSGVQECSFDIDEEGNEKKLSAIHHGNDTMLFKLQNYRYNAEENKNYFEDLIETEVETYNFVKTFYTAFTDFYQSDKYDKKTNDTAYLYRHFEHKFGKSMHNDDVMDTLLTFNAGQLRYIFLGIESESVNFLSDQRPLRAKFLETIRKVMQKKSFYENKSPYWFKGFETMSVKSKVDYILGAFHEDTGEASYAFDLQNFQSKHIETYLLSKSKTDYFHRDTLAFSPDMDVDEVAGVYLADIKINGVHIFGDLFLDVETFLSSTRASGTYPLFVCGCGDEGCGGVFNSPKVTIKEETILWDVYQPQRYTFRFDKQALLEQAKLIEERIKDGI